MLVTPLERGATLSLRRSAPLEQLRNSIHGDLEPGARRRAEPQRRSVGPS